MSSNPNKLSQFWQELKRRKVTRTITVYAAAAFVTLELVSIIVEPLKLPEWTLPMIIVLLCVGFIIAVILSWIYDIHPEGGIVKTESAKKVSEASTPPSSRGWKIASYISFVVIIGLLVLNIIPRTDKKEILDKSIAVLPFINDSQDQDNEHLINGIMEDLLINLQSIKELRVPGRTSVEQYRNNPKPIPEIASEMNVSYIVEGSGQRYGNKIRLRVQLVDGATDKHLWADSYDEEIKEPEDIFRIQSQIAQSIAQELKAIITPQEQEVIERTLTSSLSAYDFFLRGREEHIHYRLNRNNTDALERAEHMYHSALEYDSSYAQAYSGLAMAYWDKHYWETYFTENFLDSVLIYSELALSYDDKLAEAYSLKGDYYKENGDFQKALQEYETALTINPNYWQAYAGAGDLYMSHRRDYVKGFENLYMAVNLNHDQELPSLLRSLSIMYLVTGFPEKTKNCFEEAFKLDGDSMSYLSRLITFEIYLNDNYSKAIEIAKQGYRIDSNNFEMLEQIAWAYQLDDQFERAVNYYQKLLTRLESLNIIRHNMMHRVAYSYWKIGDYEKSDYYFGLLRNYAEESVRLNREYAFMGSAYYDLASIFAFMNEKDKAFENLRIYVDLTGDRFLIGMRWFFRNDPLFDSIRDEPEFQQIVRDVESKYQAEHERVRQWLEENDML